jgi:predicted metal-dependent hydrolase
MSTFTSHGLDFELRESPQRRTIGIAVERDGSLTLTAPTGISKDKLEAAVRAKQLWIHQKLVSKEELNRSRTSKRYLTGEGFFYLGKSYRLKFVEHSEVPLKLTNGWFELIRSERPRAREIFIDWYTERLEPILQAEVAFLEAHLEVRAKGFQILDLGFRWGWCSHAGHLQFHWRLAMQPRSVVRYVVAHELGHLREPHHGEVFWQLLEKVLPEYEKQKNWLAKHGASFDL